MNPKTIPKTTLLPRGAQRLAGFILITLFALSACTGDKLQYSPNLNDNDGTSEQSPTDGPQRFATLEPLNLEPGEALPGIHLRPGIEVIRLTPEESGHVVIDEDEMTLTVTGPAKDSILEEDEIWSGDILIGDGFIYIIEDIYTGEDGELIIVVSEFYLLDVIHGEWSIAFGPDSDSEQGLRKQGLETESDYTDPGLSLAFGDFKAEGTSTLTPRGGISFPVGWDGQFEGKVSVAGRGINTAYDCETYTETRTRWYINPRRYTRGAEYDVNVTPERFCVDYVLVKGTMGVEASFGYTLESEGTFTFNPKDKLEFPRGRAVLGTTGLALYFEPYVEAGIKITLSGTTTHSLDASSGFTLPMGFDYRPRQYGFTLLPNSRHPVETNGELSATGSSVGGGSAKVYGELGMDLAISDALTADGLRLTGPKIAAELAAEAKLKAFQSSTDGSQDEPCLTAEFYARAYGEAALVGEIKVRGWTWSANFTGTASAGLRYVLDQYASEDNEFCQAETHQPQDLEVNLSWNAATDLDLYLLTPNGNVISYRNRNDDGGVFLSDNCIHGDCEGENNETIVWERAVPPSGEYETWAVNHDGSEVANYQIEVRTEHGVIRRFSGTLAAVRGAESNRHAFRLGTAE